MLTYKDYEVETIETIYYAHIISQLQMKISKHIRFGFADKVWAHKPAS